MSLPLLRFNDSKGQCYPNGQVKSLGEVASLFNGRAYKQTEWKTHGTPVIRLQNLTGSSNNYYYSDLKLPENQYCDKGDLLYMWSATFGPVWWQGEKAIYHYHIWKIETDTTKLAKNYLYYLLDNMTAKMKSTSNGSTMDHITKGGMEKLSVYLPHIEEQTKIAKFLTAVDEKIHLLTQKHDLLAQYKKGVMQQIFSQEFRFKDDDGGDFPEWKTKRLLDLAKVYDGTHMTPDYKESGVPFFSVEHLTNNNFCDTKFISEEVFDKENQRVKLEKGDILMTRIGDIGTPKYINWDVRASFYVSLALIKQSKNINSQYLSHFIKTPYFQKELHQRTIHVAFPKKINLGEISECLVQFPSEPEQTKIASFLTAIDDKITATQTQLQAVKQYKQGLLQQMFV